MILETTGNLKETNKLRIKRKSGISEVNNSETPGPIKAILEIHSKGFDNLPSQNTEGNNLGTFVVILYEIHDFVRYSV